MLRRVCIAAAALAFAVLAGCRGFDIEQTAIFSNENGALIKVGYGRAEKPHVNTFVNPATQKKVDFPSRLAVEVTMPDGVTFDAWQCMNFNRSGTMYRVDNGKWMFHANGFSCFVYKQLDDGLLHEVFRGILCDSPNADRPGDDDKWRKLKKDAKGNWR